MFGFLNLGSIVFGLIAWILPIIYFFRRAPAAGYPAVFCGASFWACALALCMQIIYTSHLVKIEDWSALMDTSHASAGVSVLLLVVTVILNAVALAPRRGQKT